ncbi:MAG: enoyl-CoA hydratase/isomerase family protein [Methylocystaceae bacterium]
MADSYQGKDYKNILAYVKDGIGYMKFNRPKAMNAVSIDLLDEAIVVIEQYQYDSEVRVILIYGEPHTFAVGADLREWVGCTPFTARDGDDKVQGTIMALEDSHKPVIAAVQGMALGGGLEMILACDLSIVDENAALGFPEINLGIFPGGGGTQRLPRNLSICRAKQYIFTGDLFTGRAAYEMGMVNYAVPSDQVMDTAVKMARKLIAKSPLALREAKNAINQSMNTDIKAGCRAEQLAWSMLFSSEDQKEGMRAFMEGRKPVFQGR